MTAGLCDHGDLCALAHCISREREGSFGEQNPRQPGVCVAPIEWMDMFILLVNGSEKVNE